MKNEDYFSINIRLKKKKKKKRPTHDHDAKILNQFYTNTATPEVLFKS